MTSQDQENEADMQAAFESFMLGGKTTTPTKKGSNSASLSTLTSPSPSPSLRKNKQQQKKAWGIIKAYQTTLQMQWLDIDQDLHNLMISIAHLRDCIQMECRYIHDNTPKKPSWQSFGLHSQKQQVLQSMDVEMALSRDLLKHESMLETLRRLLAHLSEGQDALGRRLEEMYVLLHEEESVMDNDKIANALECMQNVYTVLAQDVYRKQQLSQGLLDSVNNQILSVNDAENHEPCVIAHQCAKEWSASEDDKALLENMLQLGKRTDAITE
eukprot:CAMPEP_0116837964 /NCGR_PEP_ID=MMETSP0418-20121206/8948_1 /TAXON_ID=1158023 /ORGANISM="Astrosyne radiata, Strain 13vi08-1A" /LENGTH=269 /DNA_ID=CAMNT_0004467911 /DNA_START=420 /DNA_END=1229 /DNA_ORIENTATION=+